MRTVTALQSRATRGLRPLGRPPRPAPVRRRAHRLVAVAWRAHGLTAGWRSLVPVLRGQCSRTQIEDSLRHLKARHRRRLAAHRAAARTSVRVLAPGAVWSQDATAVGRHRGRRVWAEVVRDRASHALLAVDVGRTASGELIAQSLQRRFVESGAPLVWQTDRGSAYQSAPVQSVLAAHRVVWLPSRPQVPQDNAGMERAIGELKAEAQLTSRDQWATLTEPMDRLHDAADRLNATRIRPLLGAPALAHVASRPRCYHAVNRDAFYEYVCSSLRAVKPAGPGRIPPELHRRVVYEALDRFGVVEINRGTTANPGIKPEGLS